MISSLIQWCSYDPHSPVIKNRFSRIIKRLETKGFVEKSNSNKGKRVQLTQFGKVYAEAVKAS
jgi:DNA-binding MarR family transcriptional regulator